jgi:hypothetical protein
MHPGVHLPPTEAELAQRPDVWLAAPRADNGESNLIVRACPVCGGGELVRIKRRPIDVLMSAFVPLCRVRCYNFNCQYEGNLLL